MPLSQRKESIQKFPAKRMKNNMLNTAQIQAHCYNTNFQKDTYCIKIYMNTRKCLGKILKGEGLISEHNKKCLSELWTLCGYPGVYTNMLS